MARRKNLSLCNRPPMPITDTGLDVPHVMYKDITSYDENGEVISSVTIKNTGKNGGGFVISYTAKMDEFIKKTSTAAVVRVFLYLAHHQNYGVDGIFGFRCNRQHIADALGLNRRSVYSALEYLIDQFLVNEMRVAGTLEYMVNPAYVTVGSNRKARDREWSQRWEFYWKYKHHISKGGSVHEVHREDSADVQHEN